MTQYLNYIFPLFEGLSVVITTAFIVFRLPFFHQNLRYSGHNKTGMLFLIAFFSLMAIYGTHSGMIVAPDNSFHSVPWSYDADLQANEAIINFRDLVVVSAGLVGGPFIGVVVGAVAGIERYQLGGFTALACAIASLLSGIISGQIQRIYANKVTPVIAAATGAIAVIVQMLLIAIIAQPYSSAIHLISQVALPILIITMGGCYLYIHIIKAIEGDRLKMQAHYNAQIEPHFLMNTLNAIRSLIRIDPTKARHYVTHLGEFMRQTQQYARKDSICIADELAHAQRYIDFQQLRFPDKIDYQATDIEESLLANKIPPRTLLTLVENCLIHGRDKSRKLHITVQLFTDENTGRLVLAVDDDGKGIESDKLVKTGKKKLKSKHEGGGRGLYNLSQTLQLCFGKAASLDIKSQQGKWTKVRLTIPSIT